MGKLTVAKVRAAGPGRHGDGEGLYLLVKPTGARSWLLRLQHGNKRRDIGLGAVDVGGRDLSSPIMEIPLLHRRMLTLGEAREKATMLRQFAKAGLDPLAERDRDRAKPEIPTFAKAVELALAELRKGMPDKEATAFESSLRDHAFPVLGRRLVDGIESADISTALRPIWTSKPAQARKVRRRIVRVLAFAKASGWRSAPVPYGREVSDGLARQPDEKHFDSMPWAKVPDFVAGELAKRNTAARLALLFTILTASRSGAVRQAEWGQLDLEAKLWRCPAEIMKSKRDHNVTLSPAALAVIERAGREFGRAGLLFPSAKPERPLSDAALLKILRMAGASETVHGFRASFRTWVDEWVLAVDPGEERPVIELASDAAEFALAHKVGSDTEAAYRRGGLEKQRFALLGAWGAFVAPELGREAVQ